MICIYNIYVYVDICYVYVYMYVYMYVSVYIWKIYVNQNLIDIFLLFVVNAEVDTNFCFKLLFYKFIFIFFWLRIESSQ